MSNRHGEEDLYIELRGYEAAGIDMHINGYDASPLQILTACMTKEVGTYMRDYVINEDGNIEALDFYTIN